jgi:protoporphyrinogen oxidase
MDITIVGGGIAGMGLARMLALKGMRVALLEAGPELGGLGSCFTGPEGVPLDRYYHCILPTDVELLGLIRELGLGEQLHMTEGGLGFVYQGKSYPLATAIDLLRFRPLTLLQRIRVGLLALSVRRDSTLDSKLDGITAATWIRAKVGQAAADRIWRPLLEAKFGNAWDQVPALWLKGTLAREKNADKEIKGSLHGGMRPLIDALHADLRDRGVEVRTGFPVNRVTLDGRHVEVGGDAGKVRTRRTVLAVPVTKAQAMLRAGGVNSLISSVNYDQQGVVCGLFLLDSPLDGHYWTAVVDTDVNFAGVVEMGLLRPPEHAGGYHIVYVTKYVHHSSAAYQEDDKLILDGYERGLRKLYPHLKDGSIRHKWLFKAPIVEPIYNPGFLDKKPPLELIPDQIYLANVHQVYPGVTSWNSSLLLARRLAEWIVAREHSPPWELWHQAPKRPQHQDRARRQRPPQVDLHP